MALNYMYMFEFVVDDLLITTMNECAPEEYPTYVEMSYRSQCYVSICDQEVGGCMEATCRNGKCALFALDEELSESDTLFVHVYKRRAGKKCKFLLGVASVPVYTMFKKVTRHFHEENPLLANYLGINLDDEDEENTNKQAGDEGEKRQSSAGEKRQSNAGEKRQSTQGAKKNGDSRKKGGQDQEIVDAAEDAADAAIEEQRKADERAAEKRESAKSKKKERRPCPVREEPPPPESKYKSVCQAMAEEAQSAKNKERDDWEAECQARYAPQDEATEEQRAQEKQNDNNNNSNEGGDGECPKEPLFVAGCITEVNPRQEEYCPTAEISKKLLSLLHCNGKQTGNIVLVIRLSCMGPCIVSPFIFGKNSLCQPPLCAPDCEPPATQPCDKKKGRTDYPGPPSPIQKQSNTFSVNYHSDRATGGGVGGPPSCCPSQRKKCCKPQEIRQPVRRYFNCDPCAGCPFADRPCETPNCPNLKSPRRHRHHQDRAKE